MKHTDGQYHISSQNYRKDRVERNIEGCCSISKDIKTKGVGSLIKINPEAIQVVVPGLIKMPRKTPVPWESSAFF